jgi:hypothetical protein
MEAAAAYVAVEAFELIGFEHASTAGDLHRDVHRAEGTLNTVILHRHKLGRPLGAVIDAMRPVCGIPSPRTWSLDHWRQAVWVENTGVRSTLWLGNCLT